MVFDHAGQYLYITTTDGFVQRCNLATGQLESSYNLGGSLNGADITPDDAFLLVAQQQVVNGQGKVQKVNLATGTVTDVFYPLKDSEGGGHSLCIAANGRGFVTSTQAASSGEEYPLHVIDLASNTASARSDLPTRDALVAPYALLIRNFDATSLYLMQGGPIAAYSSSTNTFAAKPRAAYAGGATAASLNRNTSLLASRQTRWYGSSVDSATDLSFIRALRDVDAGVAFDPTHDVLYGVDSINARIIATDSNAFEELFEFNTGESVDVYPNTPMPFDTGYLVASPDGHYLALTTPSGVRLFTIPSPPYPSPPPPDYGEPRGMVFDHNSEFLYATTTTGYVLAFKVATTALERVYHPGGWLYGIDIASDDSYLLVAQAYSGIKQGAIQKVNLASGAVTNLSYDKVDWERGANDVHITSNNRAFFSTLADSANVPIRQIDLVTGVVTTRDIPTALRGLNGGIQIQRSADRSLLYFLEPNNSSGLTFTYHANLDTFGGGGDISTYFDLTNAAVNRNGTLAALRYADTVELQAGPDFHSTHSFPDFAGGVAFDATKDVLYALTTTTDEIIAYDTTTYTELSRMWIGEDLPGPLVGKLFGIGSLVASQDGRYLALLSPTAISLFNLQTPPGPRPNYTITVNTSPSNGGTVTGGGTFPVGGNVAITATPNLGFVFAGWTENGALVNASEGYSFSANANRTLVANFLPTPTIIISASPTTVRKGDTATFRISTPTVNSAKPIFVSYVLSGSAIPGSDYTLSPQSFVTIPAGQSFASASLTVTTTKTKKSEKATMVLISGADYKLAPVKKRKNPNQATVTIQNK
jgi:hypothetical protein